VATSIEGGVGGVGDGAMEHEVFNAMIRALATFPAEPDLEVRYCRPYYIWATLC
jgi:hypothetical protein